MGVKEMGLCNDGMFEKVKTLALVLFFVFVLGVVSGTIFYMKSGEKREYANGEIVKVSDIMIKDGSEWGIVKNVFIENIVNAFLIFFSAFFKAGFFITILTIMRNGFIAGFFSATAIGAFGIKGALIPATVITDLVPGVILFIIFGSISMLYSMGKIENRKKFLIFFLIFLISTFCVLALLRGFVTTTFMKFVYPKII